MELESQVLHKENDSESQELTENKWPSEAIGPNASALHSAVAKLGWVAGPIVVVLYPSATYYASIIDAERCPPPSDRWLEYVLKLYKPVVLYGSAIGYMTAGANSMRASKCFHTNPRSTACQSSLYPNIIIFGALEMFLGDHFPILDQIIPPLMFFMHSSAGLVLGIARLNGNGKLEGSMHGTIDNLTMTTAAKAWSILEALAGIVLAYSPTKDLSNTRASSRRESKRLNLTLAILVIVFNLLHSCVTYAAFGHESPKDLYTGSGFNEPFWLIDIANAATAIQMLFSFRICTRLFITDEIELSNHRVLWRSVFVITTMAIAILLPFMDSVFGIVGVLMFWPLSVYFPVKNHISKNKLPKRSYKWVCLKIMSLVLLLVSVAGLVGSVPGAIHKIKNYRPFAIDC